MRLINADKLKETIPNTHTDIFENCSRCKLLADGEVCDLIDAAPTVDAVPVVRCKDCKHRDVEITVPAPEESPYESFTFASCPCKSFNIGDDFFCAYGERKDGDHE